VFPYAQPSAGRERPRSASVPSASGSSPGRRSENRPAGALARRVVSCYPGRMPAVLLAEWLVPLVA
jgi:hypothetical protein